MKIDVKGVLITLLFFALILTNIIQCNEEKKIPIVDIDYHLLDSLNNVISVLRTDISKQEIVIDSLKKQVPQIQIKYETDIKNFRDVHVISDDSITKYIRSKIDNL